MIFTTFIAQAVMLTAATFAVQAIGVPVQEPTLANYHGYPLVPLHFNGTIDGTVVEGWGTVQEIYAQQASKGHHFPTPKGTTIDASTLVVRSKYRVDCGPIQDWKESHRSLILDGIAYLKAINGACHLGPRQCSRISCSYGGGILFCNDGNGHIYPDCSYLATYAEDIVNRCTRKGDKKNFWVLGQEFDTDNYNIIVRDESC